MDKVHKVMSEFKSGELKSSSGEKVRNTRQAIAIALGEARDSGEGGKKGMGKSHGSSNSGEHSQEEVECCQREGRCLEEVHGGRRKK